MDLSFISLTAVCRRSGPRSSRRQVVCLIKPQFEVGKEDADRHRGVIRDETLRLQVVARIRAFAAENLPGATEFGFVESPIQGAEGNVEYLLGLAKATADR
jgi:23S rRNA (cytidine1920-2'-O)/16S rRNA (cytidine1409-2'-O)-methyltransferase